MSEREAVFDFNDVLESTRKYFKGDELAASVFASKYALTTPDGSHIEENPSDMHRRIARELARVEEKHPNPLSESEIMDLLESWKVVPQGSPLSGIGNPYQVQSISNCFVVESPRDSYGGILFTDQEQVQIMKRRGGVGFDLSNIRPRGLSTSNAARTTDGIGVFMERFSNSCREVAQGGRRGALMLTIDCRHPEIETFINIKRDRKKVTGANISIRFTDDFMHAVTENKEFTLRWPVTSDPEEAQVVNTVQARDIWEKFVDAAWDSAEPGALFWDRVIIMSPADTYSSKGYQTISTNPCSELPLSAYDSCRLLVINLEKFVVDPFKENAYFDFEAFADVSQKAQRLMDDFVTLEHEAVLKIIDKIDSDDEPEDVKQIERNLWEKILEATLGGRRTGLGITALGDTLAALGISYGSEHSIRMTEKIYRVLAVSSYTSSIIMASERGSFPIWDPEIEKQSHPFLDRIWAELPPSINDLRMKFGRRNIALLTTAPVGSVSCMTQTTSGIEPVYMLSYKRRKKIVESAQDVVVDFVDELGDRWQEFTVYHHGVEKWMKATGKKSVDETCPYWKATAPEIDWVQSVKLQAAAQKWVCHGISKTCNLPHDVTRDVVSEVYMAAWKSGCKGFTVYREGSRSGVLVSTDDSDKNIDAQEKKISVHHAPKRPEALPCDIHQVTIKGEEWTILIGILNGIPYEIMGGFSQYVEIPKKFKTGTLIKRPRKTMPAVYDLVVGENGEEFKIKNVVAAFDNPNHSSFTRILSLSLRHGAPINYIVEQIQKGDKDMDLFSFSKGISRVLKKYIEDGVVPGGSKDCPECNAPGSLVYTEGCVSCVSCGHSKCT